MIQQENFNRLNKFKMLEETFLNKLMLFSNRELNNNKNALFSPYSLKLGLLSLLQDMNHDKYFSQLLKVLQLNSIDEINDIITYENNFHSTLLKRNTNSDKQIKLYNKVLASRHYSLESFPNYNDLKDIKKICFQAEHAPVLKQELVSRRIDKWLSNVFSEDLNCFPSKNIFAKSKTVLVTANLFKVLWDDMHLFDRMCFENFR